VGWVVFIALSLGVVKVALVAGLARAARLPGVRPLQLALGLGQMGEFSFAIAVIAADHGALAPPVFEAVLVTLVVSLAASTVLARLSGPRRQDDPP